MEIGFVGLGKMGKAMLKGILNEPFVSRETVRVRSGHPESTQAVANEFGVQAVSKMAELSHTDLIINATLPEVTSKILPVLDRLVKPEATIVSVAYGVDLNQLQQLMPHHEKLIYMIPNLPVAVNSGILAANLTTQAKQSTEVIQVLEELGNFMIVPASQMEAISAAAGSAPAYLAMFFEGLVDALVLNGIRRDQAEKIAVQMGLGTAQMLQNEDLPITDFKNQVASPGGSTIRGLVALENNKFRASVIEAIQKTIQ